MEVAAQKFENTAMNYVREKKELLLYALHAFREKNGFHFMVMLILPGDLHLHTGQ